MVKKDIIIIPKVKQKQLSSIERDLIYDDLGKKYNIDIQHIENFKQNDDILKDIKYRLEYSEISNILLKNILKYTYPIIDNNSDNNKLKILLDYELEGLLYKDNKFQLIKIPKYQEISIIGILYPSLYEKYYTSFNIYFSNNKISYFWSKMYKMSNHIIKNNFKLIDKLFIEDTENSIFNDIIFKHSNLKIHMLDFKNIEDNLKNIYDMINYYLNYYDVNLCSILKQNVYNKKNTIIIHNLFNYYENLPVLYNENIDTYKTILNNEYTFSNNYKLNIIYTFKELGLILLYDYLYLYGIDSKIVKQYIERLKNDKIITNQNIENYKKILKNNLNNITYYQITQNKFPNLFNINHKDNLFNKQNSFNLSKLPKKYKEIVLLEFKKQENFNKAYRNNDCPHISIYDKYRHSNNINKKLHYFKLLKEFINLTNNIDYYYKCNNCGFDIICPHQYEIEIKLLKINIDKLSSQLDKTYEINEYIINKYMSNAPIDFYYFCRICSERIGKSFYLEQPIEFKDNTKLNTAEDYDELKKEVVSNVYHIVLKYINFNILTINKKKIIFNVVDIITPIINDLDIQLSKNKSLTQDEINDRLKLNIVIYTFASIIQLMILNKELSFFENDKTNKKNIVKFERNGGIIVKIGERENPQVAIIKTLLQKSFDLIVDSQNILINKLNLTNNDIKQLLIKSYSIINNQSITTFVNINDTFNNIHKLIISNPIYEYVYNVKQMFPLIKKNDKYITNNTKEYEFSDIINKSIDNFSLSKIKQYQKEEYTINNNSSILDLVYNKYDAIYNNIFDKISIPDFIQGKKNEEISNINTYNEYIYLSYKVFRYFIINSIYKYSPDYYQYIKYSQYDIEIINTYLSDNKKLLDYDNILEINRKKKYLPPIEYLPSSLNRKYIYKINNLNRYYCINGKYQKFDILIFKNKTNNKKIEVQHNKLDKFINNDSDYFNNNLKLVDRYNSQCNEYYSNIDNNNNDKINNTISNNIRKIDLIKSFYHYYNFKCPVDERHIFENNICKKCKIHKSYIIEKNETYFNKFKNKFYEDLEKRNNKIIKQLNDLPTNYNYSIDDYKKDIINKFKDIDKFTIDLNYISLFSKKFKINEKYLLNIGLTEDKDYDEFPNLDLENINEKNSRYLKLKNILQITIIYYNKLRFSEYIVKFDNLEFKSVIDIFIKNNGTLKDLKKLKDIPYNFYNIIKYYKLIKNDEINDIILNIIYNFLYFILEQGVGPLHNIINDFVEFLLNRILEFDEIYSNYSLIKLKKDREDSFKNTITTNIDYDYYDDDEIDLDNIEGDIINYDAFDLDLVDNDIDDIDSFD